MLALAGESVELPDLDLLEGRLGLRGFVQHLAELCGDREVNILTVQRRPGRGAPPGWRRFVFALAHPFRLIVV